MKPTHEQYLTGSARWIRTHRGIGYELSHHGISDYSPEGTWCYYLYLRPDTFQRAEDWTLFDKPEQIKDGLGTDKKWLTYDYDDLPDLEFHGGVTWFSREPYFDRRTAEHRYAVKIGCDYNHSWDRDGGYWQDMDDVERDAKRSIDLLVMRFPLNERCSYSGLMGPPEQFYTAINGNRVHVSHETEFTDDNWPSWRRATEETLEPAA